MNQTSQSKLIRSQWKSEEDWWEIKGLECSISLERRPHYCDRGAFIEKLDAWGELGREIDSADRWPRYYFDFERAKLEIEAWLKKRRQWIDSN